MKKQIWFLSMLVLTAFPAFAVKEYYEISKSIRSLGMGGAFFGLSDDEYALFSNPAGLSLRRTGSELMLRLNGHVSKDAISGFKDFSKLGSSNIETAINALDEYKDKPLQGNAGLLPYYVSKNLGIGLLLADTKLAFNVLKNSNEVAALIPGNLTTKIADLTFVSDTGLVVGYAQSVVDPNLHVGLNLKGLFRAGGRKDFTAQDYLDKKSIKFDPDQIGGSGLGIDADLGATYEFTQLPFGLLSRASLVLSNLLASQFTISKKYQGAPGLVRTANLGWYTVFDGFAFVDNVHALLDISNIGLGGEDDPDYGARTGNFLKKLHLGVELPMGRFSVRAGLNQGYLTAGVGLNLYALRLDLATYGEETGADTRSESRRYALTLALGLGSAPPAPVTGPVKDSSPIITPATPEPEVKKEETKGSTNPEAAPKKESP